MDPLDAGHAPEGAGPTGPHGPHDPFGPPGSTGPHAAWPQRWRAAHQRWHARQHHLRHSLGHSLKWRLVIVFLLLALATTGVFLLGMKRVLQTGWQTFAQPLVADYVDRLAAEIGSPPDAARARALAERLPVAVRIDGPQVQFESHPGLVRAETWQAPWFARGGRPSEAAAAGVTAPPWTGDHDGALVRHTADGHRLQFALRGPPRADAPRRFGWITLAVLLGLVWAAFAYVRRLLAPLELIGAGVARYGAGNFSAPIAVRRRDELGELAERVNRMAGSLQGMLEAKRALLLAISHELRSPLTRARLNAELVDGGEARDALLRDLGEMRDLITDLLESERLAQGHAALQTEPVDLAALVREVAGGFTHPPQAGGDAATVAATHAEPDIAPAAAPATTPATTPDAAPVRLQLDEGLGPVQADPVRLRLLLRNLLANALRHGRGTAGTPAPVVSLARAPDGMLVLAVRDHGPGVPADQLARLAEPFHRTDAARTRSAGGVGLGLYLCRLVAEAHGGRLELSPADPGLRAAMVWPAAAAGPAP
jgi:signal transduction histidine kinase